MEGGKSARNPRPFNWRSSKVTTILLSNLKLNKLNNNLSFNYTNQSINNISDQKIFVLSRG